MELTQKLVAALFPSRCLLCRKTVQEPVILCTGSGSVRRDIGVCDTCYDKLPRNQHCCSRCALPLPTDTPAGVMCGRCIKQLPAFDYCHSPFCYDDDIIRLVHQLKFSDRLVCARSISEILLSVSIQLFSRQGEPDCILPVPLHSRRLRSRGYNQSTEIARLLASSYAITLDRASVYRQRHTSTQTGLDAMSRVKNIRGAFSLKRSVEYSHVLIIDDVVTTGATVNELARLLKKNGVGTVGVLSFARAPMKN